MGNTTLNTATLLERVTYHATCLDQLDYDRIRADLQQHSIARVVGLVDRDVVRAGLKRIQDGFDIANDRKHDPRDTDAIRRNFQKLQIGAKSGGDHRRTLGRFLRILYNPIFAEDIYGLRSSFMQTARFRNRLYLLPENFAVEGTDDGFFTCARVHQYPRGGGFMVPHRDMFSRLVTEDSQMGYFQVFFLLTEKGTDYHEGGGYIQLNGEQILFEDFTQAGDIVIYDGRTVHGVADVDPLAPLELNVFRGRAAAFVSLYKSLPSGTDAYDRISTEAVNRFTPTDNQASAPEILVGH